MDPQSGQHTNTIEGLWRHLKAYITAYNRRKVFFNGYVQKFIFLRWCKANGKNAFVEFLKLAGTMYDPLKPKCIKQEDLNLSDVSLFSDSE